MGNLIRVLVGDDCGDDQYFLARAFQRACPNAILDLVQNGQEVIQYLEDPFKPRPSLLILDTVMAKINGFDVLVWLRATKAYEELPVIMLSGNAYEQNAIRAKDLGAAYVFKPDDPGDLDAMAQNWTRLYLTPRVHICETGSSRPQNRVSGSLGQ